MKQSKQSQFNAWIRCVLLTTPMIGIDGVRQAFSKSKLPTYFKVLPSTIVEGWEQLKERYGLNGPESVPQHHGELNVSGLIRCYIEKFGMEKTESEARAYFAEDGIHLRPNAFSTTKSVMKSNGVKVAAEKPVKTRNVNKTPRKPSKVFGDPLAGGEVSLKQLKEADYEKIEVALDELLVLANKLDNHPLFADLRTARRRASAAILS